MPVALERKLKREVAGKKMSKDRKDAYVYGTLRKTGWKPSREKKELSAKLDSLIEFGAEILAPWQGSTGHTSKIDQLEFPAGLSPAAALKFPLPVLMRYLNQRNLLQQQFSWKQKRLIELSAKLDEIHASTHPTQ